MVKVPVNPAGDDLTELNRTLKQNQIDREKQAEKDKASEKINKSNDYVKDELNDDKNYEGTMGASRGGKLKPAAEDAIKEKLNSIGNDLRTTVIPAEKGWLGSPKGKDKYKYSIINKKQEGSGLSDVMPKITPISPKLAPKGGAKTSKLSGIPTNVLLTLAQQRGLEGIA